MAVNGIGDGDGGTQGAAANGDVGFSQAMAAARGDSRIQLAQALPSAAPVPSPPPAPGGPPAPSAPPPDNVIQFPRLPGGAGAGGAAAAEEAAAAGARLLPIATVVTLPLALHGDTPVNERVSIAGFPGLSGERNKETGEITISQKTGWFSEDTLTRLNVKSAYPGGSGDVKGVGGQQVGAFDEKSMTVTLSPEAESELAGRMQRGVPGDEELSTTSYRTKQRMDAATSDPCRDFDGQRHHMTPAQLMEDNQRFLRKIGFSLDDGLRDSTGQSNLLRLPKSDAQRQAMMADPSCGDRTIHNGSHPMYTKAVNQRLGQIRTQFEQGRLSVDQARTQMSNFMQALQRQLTSGQFSSMNDPNLANTILTMRF